MTESRRMSAEELDVIKNDYDFTAADEHEHPPQWWIDLGKLLAHVAYQEQEIERLREALKFYGNRKQHHNGAGGDPVCPIHGGHTCGLFHRDSYDDHGPGARARQALSQTPNETRDGEGGDE